MSATNQTGASTYDRALVEVRRDAPDLQLVVELLEAARAEGDARATYALATWYVHGKEPIICRDLSMGVRLLKEAANGKNADAMYDLAFALETGADGEKDVKAAFRWYLKAALRGDIQSVYEVGRCYFYGIGTRKSRRMAKVFLERALELGIKDTDNDES